MTCAGQRIVLVGPKQRPYKFSVNIHIFCIHHSVRCPSSTTPHTTPSQRKCSSIYRVLPVAHSFDDNIHATRIVYICTRGALLQRFTSHKDDVFTFLNIKTIFNLAPHVVLISRAKTIKSREQTHKHLPCCSHRAFTYMF